MNCFPLLTRRCEFDTTARPRELRPPGDVAFKDQRGEAWGKEVLNAGKGVLANYEHVRELT